MINIIPVPIINDYCISTTIMASVISTVVIIIITAINPNCYNGSKCKIRWIISVMIRRVIGYVYW